MTILEFEVNGEFKDFSDIVAAGGLKVIRTTIHTAKTGRSKLAPAPMHIGILARKRKIPVTCLRMTDARIRELEAAIGQEPSFRARYKDFAYAEPVIKTFYNTEVESAILYADGEDVYWDGATFNLVEV